MKRAGLIVSLLILAGLALLGQDAQQNPVLPTITFDRVWEAYKPQEVTITVQSTGSAQYISRNPFTPPEPGADPDYTLDFTLSSRNQKKLFRRCQRGQLFQWRFQLQKTSSRQHGQKDPDVFRSGAPLQHDL